MAFSRITDSMMNYGFLTSLQSSLTKQYKLQEQMADGKIIHRASDDPVRVIRSLQYRSAVVQNEQFTSNVKDAQSWMEITDKAVNDLSSLMASAKEIVVRAIAPNPAIGYDAAAKELDGIINQMVSVADTKIGDRYIFSGQMDKTQPFERVKLADPQGRSNLTLDKVVYYGDNRKISMITQPGEVNPFRDSVNLTGLDVFGRTDPNGTNYAQATTDVFNKLIRIKEELEKTATANQTNSLGGVIDIDGHYTGTQEFQDFAVKIDALRVKAGTTVQSYKPAGSLQLAWAGDSVTLPANIDQVKATIDSIGIDVGGVAKSGILASGDLNLEATGPLQASITNIVSVTNPTGSMTVSSPDYRGSFPAPQQVRVTATAFDVSHALTAATYETSADGVTWSGPYNGYVSGSGASRTLALTDSSTVTPGSGPGKLGIVMNLANDAANNTNDQYTFDLSTITNVKLQIDAVQANITGISKSNALGGAMTISNNAYMGVVPAPKQVEITSAFSGVPANVTSATYRITFDGLTWSGPYNAYISGAGSSRNVALINSTTATPGAGVGNLGIVTNIASDTENVTADTYSFNLATTGKVLAASYSTSNDNGVTWTPATPTAVTATDNNSDPMRFALGATNVAASVSTNANNGAGGVFTTNTSLNPNGEVLRVKYALHDIVKGWSTDQLATVDNHTLPNWFSFGTDGFQAKITANSNNVAGDAYTLSSLFTNGEVAAVSYSLDEGDTWKQATPEPVGKSNAASGNFTIGGYYEGLPAYEDIEATVKAWQVTPTVTPSRLTGGSLKMAYAGAAIPAAVTTTPPHLRIDETDATTGRVTGLSYSSDGTAWTSATSNDSQGAKVFSLGGTYAGFYVSVTDTTANKKFDTYTTAVPGTALDVTDPALTSYTLTPAPDLNGTLTASTAVWSMKGANAGITGFQVADGLTADIASNAGNTLAQTYTFRVPPRFDLAYGIEASIVPNSNNFVKDAYIFHMPQSSEGPEHNSSDLTVGPDMEWLSAKGLADIDTSHDQILKAVVEVGTRASMYEMTGTMLESSNTSLTSILASNEDLDMAKAIIDLKTAENSYKASLSFGSRILPTSLVDFLK